MKKKLKDGFTYFWQVTTVALLCMSLVACTVDEVLSSIDVALQTAQQLSAAVGAVSPADAALLNILTGVGIAGVQAIQTAYDAYEKNKTSSNLQNVVVAAQAIQTNLPQELSALHISDPNAVSKATAWVNLMTDCAQAIISEITANKSAGAKAAPSYKLTPEYIQSRWQTDVCGGNTSCGTLVKVHHKHTHSFKL